MTLEVGVWLLSMTHCLIITNICAKLFQISLINDKLMDRTQKYDGQTDGTHFYIPLFSWKGQGTKIIKVIPYVAVSL
jgi:hypothetical protein